MAGRPVRTVAWTLTLLGLGIMVAGAIVIAAGTALDRSERHARILSERRLPAASALSEVLRSEADGQRAFVEAVLSTDVVVRAQALDQAQKEGARQDAAWTRFRRLGASASAAERRLEQRYESVKRQARAAGAAVFGLDPSDPAVAATLASEIELSESTQDVLVEIQERFYTPVIREEARATVASAESGRTMVLVTAGVALLVFLVPGLVILRRAARFERSQARRERETKIERRHSELETRLQRGLEMESTEVGTYEVIKQAVESVSASHPVELLVADSSRAHFHQVISTAASGEFGCQVGAPNDCPAASSSQTRIFADSRSIDTCPYLRHKSPAVWATCVPVSIAGRTRGVLHAEDEIERSAVAGLPVELELVARKAGERIGVLRVLARTEAQAQVDPLTGLPNRRTLEDRTRELLETDMPFVVAFADLDHFKQLNDLHGHDTGDRALRLFARVLRNGVRPSDIPARYGGEEFVVVLPDCSIVDARVVAERIRCDLADALVDASVPAFTVSIGLAGAEAGEAVSEVIERADGALLKAKQLGRDRVLAAGQILDPGKDLVIDESADLDQKSAAEAPNDA
jgi:diguanylate cyclase (GGDEF)-like protein